MTSDAVNETDRRDIRASLGGDSEAFARIVARYQNDVAACMVRFSRRREVCEELVQNVFVEAYFSLRGFRGQAPLAHWLRKIAVRVGYRYWKERERDRSRATLSPEEWDRLADAAGGAPDPTVAGELVHAMLERLPPRDRLVLTLTVLEGKSAAETAALLGWTRTMVKVQAHRARGKLKRLLGEHEGGRHE